VLIVTDHFERRLPKSVVQHAALVVDTRNATRDVRDGREKVVKA
jgi:UDP-N-acetyl-D-mannosaminuronate dehydrogenase